MYLEMLGCSVIRSLRLWSLVTAIWKAGEFSGLHWILYRIVFEVQLTGALLTTFIVNVQL